MRIHVEIRWIQRTGLNVAETPMSPLLLNMYCVNADVGEIKISIHQRIQSQALWLVGGLFTRHGGTGSIYNKVYFDRDWSMATFYILGDLNTHVLVRGISLLQTIVARYRHNLGNPCIQSHPWFGQVTSIIFHFVMCTYLPYSSMWSRNWMLLQSFSTWMRHSFLSSVFEHCAAIKIFAFL